MVYEIQRISVWSVIKITFLGCGLAFFLIGLFFYVILFPYAASRMGSELGFLEGATAVIFILLIFFMAIFYAFIITMFTAIVAWIHNVLGGIKFHLGEEYRAIGDGTQKFE